MDKIITAVNIHKSYVTNNKTVNVLRGIGLEVSPGESIAVCGPSGAGKSTLLHILGLMDKPSDGAVIIRGTDTKQLSEPEFAGLRNKYIGFIFQFHYLLPDFTVEENVSIPVKIADNTYMHDKSGIDGLLERTGIDSLRGRFPDEISGGEQQRVALVRALVNKPVLILADEPTGNLDKDNSDRVVNLLFSETKLRNVALVVATHNMELAKNADRIIYIKDGKIS